MKTHEHAYCEDCKIEMELVIPDDTENYWKCPKCKVEIPQEDEL